MKILIASDIHGSFYYANKVVQQLNSEKADLLIILGDIYNHGARNNLPKEYSPMKVAEILNSVKQNLIVIKGNCDSAVDAMISQFDFIEDLCLISGDKKVFLSHGHIYNKDNMPKTYYDAVIYGHYHVGFIETINGITIANPGSASLPKCNSENSYLILENGQITLKNLDGKILKTQKI